MFILHTGINT